MATYYVNLDDQATGTHTGTALDPYSAWEFLGYLNVGTWVNGLIKDYSPTGDTFKIKGSYDLSANTSRVYMNPLEQTTFESWDSSLYGPWRIKFNGTDIVWFSGIFKDFIYYQTSNNNFETKNEGYRCQFYNCYIRPNSISNYISVAGSLKPLFYGCTLFGKVNAYQINQADVFDSVIISDTDYSYSTKSTRYYNCVFNIANPGFITSPVDCQFSWSNPTMPDWDADETGFNSTNILEDVTTPPQPGNIPYTDYDIDFFGNPRTGIGALSFTDMHQISKIRMSKLVDSGMIPFPIGSVSAIDRYYLCNIFGYWITPRVLEVWEKSYLGKIYYNLVLILSELGTINQEDFNKATFPLFNIYLNDEINERDFDTPNMDAFTNKVTFRIECFNKISRESSNAIFDADEVLDNLLKLFISKINANKTINSLTEGEFYITSRRVKSGHGNDIFIPKMLIINLTVNYSQSMLDPLVPAYA